jgi:hypothetical protein
MQPILVDVLELQQLLIDKCPSIANVELFDARDLEWKPNIFSRGLLLFTIDNSLGYNGRPCRLIMHFTPAVISSAELIQEWSFEDTRLIATNKAVAVLGPIRRTVQTKEQVICYVNIYAAQHRSKGS